MIEFINLTDLDAYKQAAVSTECHILVMAETKCDGTKMKRIQKIFAKEKWKLTGGPTDPEARGPACGVAIATRHPIRQVPITPVTDECKEAVRSGRLWLAWTDLGNNRQGIVAAVYGHHGGSTNTGPPPSRMGCWPHLGWS